MKNLIKICSLFVIVVMAASCTATDSSDKPNNTETTNQETAISFTETTSPQVTDFSTYPTVTQSNEPTNQNTNYLPDGNGVLYFTVMVHLEGWNDENEHIFDNHATLLLELADLFEKYGAKLTIESKEFTKGCIKFDNNVLYELEQRGHGIGLHADLGGNKRTSQKQLVDGLVEMKTELESLGVDVRHVSGISSDKNWVQAALDAGFEAATGVVSYALWSLDEDLRPEGFEPYKNPAEGHMAYPWDAKGTISPWRAEDGSNWIIPSENGLLIIPSGIGLTYADEEFNGTSKGAGTSVFTDDDLIVWKNTLDNIIKYTDSNHINTYYAAWSFGSPPDMVVMEKWLRLIDKYVQDGKIVWSTVPEMIDLYEDWEENN